MALALAAVVTVAASGALGTTRKNADAVADISDATQALDLAADLLGAEVRRAGAVPYPPVGDPVLDGGATLVLSISDAAEGDHVRVRYVDDSVQDGPVLRDLGFSAALDGRGSWQLYRQAGTGVRQPLVQGIRTLRIEGWVDAAGLHPRSDLVPGALQPRLLMLRLEAGARDVRRVAVPLPSRPATEVVAQP